MDGFRHEPKGTTAHLEHLDVPSKVLVGLKSISVVLEGDVPSVVVREFDMDCFRAVLARKERLQEIQKC